MDGLDFTGNFLVFTGRFNIAPEKQVFPSEFYARREKKKKRKTRIGKRIRGLEAHWTVGEIFVIHREPPRSFEGGRTTGNQSRLHRNRIYISNRACPSGVRSGPRNAVPS